jgi:hypothetical protein
MAASSGFAVAGGIGTGFTQAGAGPIIGLSPACAADVNMVDAMKAMSSFRTIYPLFQVSLTAGFDHCT